MIVSSPTKYMFAARTLYIYDADTFKDVEVDLGFQVKLHDQDLRLFGINAYEVKRSKAKKIGDAHVAKGKAGRDAVRELLDKNAGWFLLQSVKGGKGKFGRWLAIIWFPVQVIIDTKGTLATDIDKMEVDGVMYANLNQWLVKEGHAWEREY